MNLERMFDEAIREKIQQKKETKLPDGKPNLRMQITGLEAIHGAERSGVNQQAGLLEYLTIHHDLANVKAEKHKGGTRTLYIEYHVQEAAEGIAQLNGLSGFVNAKASYFLNIKNGKEQKKIVFQQRDKDGLLLLPDDFIETVGKGAASLLKKFKFEYELRSLCAVKDFKRIPDSLSGNAFLTSLAESGWEVSDGMKFHETFTFKPEYIRKQKSVIEFGYFEGGDHASLPRVIKLDFLAKLEVVKLSSIKVEKKGKDGHNANYVIRAEQAPLVKKFANAFKRKMELDD